MAPSDVEQLTDFQMMVLTFSSFNRNACESSLLTSPPEIRTRIWQLVVTAPTIHIRNRCGTSLQHSICLNCMSDREVAVEIKTSDHDKMHPDYSWQHPNCPPFLGYPKTVLQSLRLDLRMLSVCRQIYQETALLPFKHCNFSLDDPEALESLLKNLVPQQARSIRSITIGNARYWANLGRYRNIVKNKLPGLRHLVCFASFSWAWLDKQFAKSEVLRELVAGSLLDF